MPISSKHLFLLFGFFTVEELCRMCAGASEDANVYLWLVSTAASQRQHWYVGNGSNR